jgi:preprotein translocase subunit YajC
VVKSLLIFLTANIAVRRKQGKYWQKHQNTTKKLVKGEKNGKSYQIFQG